MDVAYISTLAALAGSVVGGLTSTGTNSLTQRAQARAGQLTHELTRREDLYPDFITAASKAYGDALVSSEPKLSDLVGLYSIISRMRMVSVPRTVACADNITRTIIDTYFSPNHTVSELRDLVRAGAGAGVDPLREFSEAAREEVRLFDTLLAKTGIAEIRALLHLRRARSAVRSCHRSDRAALR